MCSLLCYVYKIGNSKNQKKLDAKKIHEFRKKMWLVPYYLHKKIQENELQHSITNWPEIKLKDFEEALQPHYWMELTQNLQSILFLSLFEFGIFLFNKTQIELYISSFERLTKGTLSIDVKPEQIMLMWTII